MHHLLETRAMLEPSQGHVMFFFYHEVGTGGGTKFCDLIFSTLVFWMKNP